MSDVHGTIEAVWKLESGRLIAEGGATSGAEDHWRRRHAAISGCYSTS